MNTYKCQNGSALFTEMHPDSKLWVKFLQLSRFFLYNFYFILYPYDIKARPGKTPFGILYRLDKCFS